jgi:FMN phosphatase YigB (HAD superfamily)
VSANPVPLAFLFDVDNTLLDNDRVRRDLVTTVESLVGPRRGQRFWELYEDVRRECDFVDFPRTLGRFAGEFAEEPGFPGVADAVLSYPYRSAAFPGAHDVLRHAASVGSVAILSDGDPVYQPAKIARAGFPDVIDGPVLVFDHKEDQFEEVRRRVPAERYVLIDDKPRILAAVRERLGDRVATLHVCQGKYAHAKEHDEFPPADRTVDALADILDLDLSTYLETSP